MPTYKLIYFNVRGLAELTRCMFKAHGTHFEDIRIEFEDWPARKEEMPYGQLPVLIINDGEPMTQGFAIARYVAEQLGYLGSNAMERYRIDEFVELTRDFIKDMAAMHNEKDDARKAALRKDFEDNKCECHLKKLKKFLERNKKGEFLVGGKLSLADFQLMNILSWLPPKALDRVDYGCLKCHKAKIEAIPQIEEWLHVRPKTEH